ncbi:MAG: hypothetical protein PVI59_10560 [Anaerolineae bacterium]|jgi:hypothetical protein
MQLSSPGFFSSSFGRIMLSVVVGLGLGGGFYTFKHNYTPGPLSDAHPRNERLGGYHSHAEFEQECLHCHAPIHCLSASRCQECHLEIARQRGEAQGLHGILPGTDKCQTCHTEHRGRDAVISRVAFVNVDHGQLTGFDLARHEIGYGGEPMTCADCHGEGQFAAERVDCITCHAGADPAFVAQHQEEFGGDCIGCHDGQNPYRDFDHAQVFALDGAHAEAACADCHQAQTYAEAAPECVVCHAEPPVHAGLFGIDCSRCHLTSAWSPTELTRHVFHLDHGGQGPVACETCHPETYVETTCDGCHEHSPEQIEALHAAEGLTELAPCAGCHPTGQPGEGASYASQNAGDGLGSQSQ